jgi:carbamoyltransferase
MYILGIGDVTHDVSVCLMKNDQIVAGIEEERVTRIKHNLVLDASKYTLKEQGEHFYSQLEKLTVAEREKKYLQSMQYCLSAARINLKQVKAIVISSLFSSLPFRHQACFIHHHLAHAASAFYPSPFKNAAILILDGYGAYTDGISECILYAQGKDNQLEFLNTVVGYCDFSKDEKESDLKETQIIFRNSLGVFYQNITLLIGMGHFGEGKTMGLSAYGKDREKFNKIREFIELKPNGHVAIDNRSIFIYCSELIGEAKSRLGREQLFQFYADLAYKHQQLLEEMIIHCCHYLHQITGEKNLCLAGGVALNSVANHKIVEKTKFENIFVQPAAGDNGISIGCAMYGAYTLNGYSRSKQINKIFSPYLGKKYSEKETNKILKKYTFQLKEKIPKINACYHAAKLISEGKIIAWFEDRSEIGPRALGNRSILADPRRAEMKDILNLRVKKRENFRPFAPAILAEYTQEYFDLKADSPYMLLVASVKLNKRLTIPAVTHVDGSARIQTVHKELNPCFYQLLEDFYKITGIPVLLSTSFNGRSEPIVETPEEAIECFLNNSIDVLFLNSRMFINTTSHPVKDSPSESKFTGIGQHECQFVEE